MGLLKEFWLSVHLEQYDQQPSFLNELADLSAFVENNKLHLSEAGVDPDVYINLTNYPVPVANREDVPHELALDTYASGNTVIRNAERIQLSYDKVASVTRRHAQAILNKMGLFGSHNLSPAADSEFTPVIPTSGSTAMVSGFKDITEDDILKLADRFDDIEAPQNSRILVLHTKHMNQLLKTSGVLRDQQKYIGVRGQINREVYEIFGFKIYSYKSGARYNKSTGAKVAWGAAAAPSTDTIASFAFVASECAKAMGDLDMFELLADPYQRGDVIGFEQRALVLPMRNKYIGAIYGAAV